MLTPEYGEAVQDIVSRLGVKARAAGISLVFAAQRPDANVMPLHHCQHEKRIVAFPAGIAF